MEQEDTSELNNQAQNTRKVRPGLRQTGVLLYLLLNFVHFAALSAARPFFSIAASFNQATIVEVGLITSLYSVGQVVFALPTGRLIDKIGSKIPVIVGCVFFVAGISGLLFAHNLIFIAICVILVGLSHVAVILGSQNVLTAVADDNLRSQYIGIYTFVNSAGSFVGPFIGGFLQDKMGVQMGFIGSAILGVLCIFIVLATPQNHHQLAHTQQRSMLTLLKNKEIMRIVTVSGIVLFSTEVTVSYFPLYGQQIGLSSLAIGTVLSVSGMSQMIIRPFLKRLVNWFRRDRVLIFNLLFGGISIVMYGLLRQIVPLVILAAVSGMMLGLATPLTLLSVSDVAPAGQSSQVLALRVMGNYMGQSVSPLIFGLMGTLAGLAPVFWLSGSILILSAKLLLPGVSLRRLIKRV